MRRSILFAALLCLATAALAQDLSVAAQNPAPVNTFELDAGYAFNLKEDADDDSFYRVVFLGKLIDEKGTPLKFAEGLDLAEPATTAAGDRPELELKLIGGSAAIGGTVIEAGGARPIQLRGLEKLNLRGSALVTGQTSGGPIQVAAGLETPPFHLAPLSAKQVSNWLVFGINAQHREQTDSNADENFGLATYRAFAGKAFGWRKSADVGETAEGIKKTFLANAATLEDAKKLRDKIVALPAASQVQAAFVDAVSEAERDSSRSWAEFVADTALGHAEAITDQQTFAVYAEASGWLAFDGADDGEFKNLLTFALDYWPLVNRDDVLLRLRYENGYQRAQPDERLNQLLLSATLRF